MGPWGRGASPVCQTRGQLIPRRPGVPGVHCWRNWSGWASIRVPVSLMPPPPHPPRPGEDLALRCLGGMLSCRGPGEDSRHTL